MHSIGSQIVTRAGPNLVVQSIEKKAGTVPVYNFIVQDFHSYFVGEPGLTGGGGAWVHNGLPCNAEDIAKVAHRWDRGTWKTVTQNITAHYNDHGAMYNDLEDYTRAAEDLWASRGQRGTVVTPYEEYHGQPQIGVEVKRGQEVGAFTNEGLIRQYFIHN